MRKIIDRLANAWAKFIALPWVVFIVKWAKIIWAAIKTEEFLYTFPMVIFVLHWIVNHNPLNALVIIVWGIIFLRKCVETN